MYLQKPGVDKAEDELRQACCAIRAREHCFWIVSVPAPHGEWCASFEFSSSHIFAIFNTKHSLPDIRSSEQILIYIYITMYFSVHMYIIMSTFLHPEGKFALQYSQVLNVEIQIINNIFAFNLHQGRSLRKIRGEGGIPRFCEQGRGFARI